MQIDIPVHAEVICSDGSVGESNVVIINPITLDVRYVVVKEKDLEEKLVPIDFIPESNEDKMHLRCTRVELASKKAIEELPAIPIGWS